MDRPLHQIMSTVFLMITTNLVFMHAQSPVSANDALYLNCSSPFHCANIKNIGYPFWGSTRSEYCGYPGFELNCQSDFPEIKIRNRTYKVLNISNTSRAIIVARKDYWDDTCPSSFINTTLNFSLFNYDYAHNLTLYYNCPGENSTSSILRTLLPPYQFHCSSGETDVNPNYFYSWDVNVFNSSSTEIMKAYLGSCGNIVVIPLQQPTLESLVRNPARVNLIRVLQVGFGLQWFANNEMCDKCERSEGQCGHDPRTDQFTCFCPDRSYPDACQSGKGSFFNKGRKILLGIVAGVVGIIMILAILLIVSLGRLQKKKKETDRDAEVAFIRNYTSLAPKRYYYSDIKRMTKSFSDKLGQGGYGNVYKGKMPDGRLVAVKLLKKSKHKGEEFINEVASISGTSHVNIVKFLGFCYEKKKRALIYEFMPNGSLDRFIYHQESSNTIRKLEWGTMYQISVGIAKGLEYLHRGCNIRIVHFDIKPHNILLDDDFCPKISDFGLAKQSEKKDSAISMMGARGTIGYIAPEVFCRKFGGVSHKSDVYSYGIMILEMVEGTKSANAKISHSSERYFPNAIYKNIEPGNNFQLDGVVTQEDKEMAKKMILVSLWCIQTNPSDRPSMHKVLEMLEGSLENLQIPPKPELSSPIRSAIQSAAAPFSTELASQELSWS